MVLVKFSRLLYPTAVFPTFSQSPSLIPLPPFTLVIFDAAVSRIHQSRSQTLSIVKGPSCALGERIAPVSGLKNSKHYRRTVVNQKRCNNFGETQPCWHRRDFFFTIVVDPRIGKKWEPFSVSMESKDPHPYITVTRGCRSLCI
jgi:hypothetical protein